MKKTNHGKTWEEKSVDDQCDRQKLYKPRDETGGTPIEILKSGKGHKDIETKLNAFCKKEDDESLYAAWKCYKHNEVQKVGQDDDDEENVEKVKAAGGLCILENKNKKEKEKETEPEPDEIQKTFHDFFFYWVAHMLKDSIHWRTKKIKGCLEKKNDNTCKKNKCNDKCKCYESWVKKKKTEWNAIKEQFRKQEGIVLEQGLMTLTHDGVLEWNLKLQFLNENTEEKSENSLDSEEIQHLKEIKNMLEKENEKNQEPAGATGKRTLMDKLIEHEEKEAGQCVEKNPDNECPKPQDGAGGRALKPEEDHVHDDDQDDDNSEEEEEEEEEDAEGGGGQDELPPEEEDTAEEAEDKDDLQEVAEVQEEVKETPKEEETAKETTHEELPAPPPGPTAGGSDETNTEQNPKAIEEQPQIDKTPEVNPPEPKPRVVPKPQPRNVLDHPAVIPAL
ncbi:hypothetical protein PFFCH_04626, partial [Plasmodium falciparum FCH/4]